MIIWMHMKLRVTEIRVVFYNYTFFQANPFPAKAVAYEEAK